MSFKRFNHLNVPSSWEQYWTKYPQGYTVMEALINWVSQVDSMVDNQNKLNENMDGFVERFDERLQSEVAQVLEEWQSSGFLEVVISEALQWQLNDYIATNEADKQQIKDSRPIYLIDYGVGHLTSATENTTIIQSMIVKAETENRVIVLPPTPPGTFIDVNDELKIENGNISIIGCGRLTTIRQTNFPKKLFSVTGSNTHFSNFNVRGINFDATGLADSFVTYSGIYVEADNVTVDNVFGDYLAAVINTASPNNEPLVGLSYTNIGSGTSVVFNLLASGTKGLKYDNIYGSYRFLEGVGTPPHLIYFSQAFGNNYDLKGGRAYAEGGTGSYAFQFKGMRGGNAGSLHAVECFGSYHVMESQDFHCDSVVSERDTWTLIQGQASLSFDSATERNSNVSIDKITIDMAFNGKALTVYTSDNVTLKNVNITTKRDLILGAEWSPDIDISDVTNVKLSNLDMLTAGTQQPTSAVGIRKNTVDGVTIHNLTTTNYTIPVSSQQGAKNVKIVGYEPTEPTKSSNRLVAFDNGLVGDENNNVWTTTSGDDWVILAGNLKSDTVNGGVYTVGDQVDGVSAWIDTGMTNITISADIRHYTNEALIIRVIDRTNYIGARLDKATNRAIIFSVDDGVETELAGVAFTPQLNRFYKHKLSIFYNQVEFYIDGNLLLTHHMINDVFTKFRFSSGHGIRGYGTLYGTFREIKWESL